MNSEEKKKIKSMENAYDFITKVKNDFKKVNRFSCCEELDKLIQKIVEEDSNKISIQPKTFDYVNSALKGEMVFDKNYLYRARIYNEPNAEYTYKNPPKGDFKGYDEKDSFVNTKAPANGRCNPKGIAYLYAAESPECCVYEVRPNRDSIISVAQIEILEELKLLYINSRCAVADNKESDIIPNTELVDLFSYLYYEFSKPASNDDDYFISQYISERIKNMGYDGIVFNSSIYSGENNKNYVIFNYNKTKAINSRLVKVKKLEIDFE